MVFTIRSDQKAPWQRTRTLRMLELIQHPTLIAQLRERLQACTPLTRLQKVGKPSINDAK